MKKTLMFILIVFWLGMASAAFLMVELIRLVPSLETWKAGLIVCVIGLAPVVLMLPFLVQNSRPVATHQQIKNRRTL